MKFLLSTHLTLAKASLKERRGRTLLTCFGISVGTASIILILSLMGSIHSLIKKQITSADGNLIVVQPSNISHHTSNFLTELTNPNFNKSNLNFDDLKAINQINSSESKTQSTPLITAIAPIAASINTLVGDHVIESASVIATTPDLKDIGNLTLKSGTFLKNDILKSAVIGKDLSLKLFGTTEPIGKTFSLLDEKFIITGILVETDSSVNINNINYNNSVLININQLKLIDPSIQIQQIDIKARSTDEIPSLAQTIKDTLVKSKKGDKNFAVSYGDNISHPAGSLLTLISGMLTLVASISLIVGGIGVMNIMLVSVSERTHEIGIRKAVGASNMNIFLQFLFESLILCISGSVFGFILGYFLSFLVSTITPFPPFINLQIIITALIIPIVVGTIFGLYPAIKAARRDPIASLKNQN